MKPQHIHQEILVSITTTLANRELQEINDNNKNMSLVEKLEEACWNGLLNEIFSDLIPASSIKLPEVFTWGIHTGQSYLLVDRGDVPNPIDPLFSIDPHSFLAEKNLN